MELTCGNEQDFAAQEKRKLERDKQLVDQIEVAGWECKQHNPCCLSFVGNTTVSQRDCGITLTSGLQVDGEFTRST